MNRISAVCEEFCILFLLFVLCRDSDGTCFVFRFVQIIYTHTDWFRIKWLKRHPRDSSISLESVPDGLDIHTDHFKNRQIKPSLLSFQVQCKCVKGSTYHKYWWNSGRLPLLRTILIYCWIHSWKNANGVHASSPFVCLFFSTEYAHFIVWSKILWLWASARAKVSLQTFNFHTFYW